MPMTMSTVPSCRAFTGSDPTSTMESFSPISSARAAAMSTSMPMILSLPRPARGDWSVFTPTRSVPSWPMAGDDTVGDLSSGV